MSIQKMLIIDLTNDLFCVKLPIFLIIKKNTGYILILTIDTNSFWDFLERVLALKAPAYALTQKMPIKFAFLIDKILKLKLKIKAFVFLYRV